MISRPFARILLTMSEAGFAVVVFAGDEPCGARKPGTVDIGRGTSGATNESVSARIKSILFSFTLTPRCGFEAGYRSPFLVRIN